MSEEIISTIQDSDVVYLIRQGNRFEFDIEWHDADDVPLQDFAGFGLRSQLRTNYADLNGKIVVDFNLVQDARGNFFTRANLLASTTFVLTAAQTRLLKPGQTFYFESKLLDGAGEPVDSVEIMFRTKAEVARA